MLGFQVHKQVHIQSLQWAMPRKLTGGGSKIKENLRGSEGEVYI